jgi:hypothetical protein
LISGQIVHSGVDAPLPPVDYVLHFPGIEALTRAAGQAPPPSRGQVYFFEGNFAPATSYDRALSAAELMTLVAQGVPPPPLPVVTNLARQAPAPAGALVWQSGAYALGDGPAVTAAVPTPHVLAGPWHIAFQPGRGAPASIELPALESLHRQSDPGVKYFSGTATYSHPLEVPADFLAAHRRVVLDLGRVEVVARVTVNGHDLGVLWKEPYRVDITAAVQAGLTRLEVAVTNLWTNRLIGDEHRPAENDYGLSDERGVEAAGIRHLPTWYTLGQPKPPGGRVTFTTWRFYDRTEPLVASGLLGPVRLLNPVQIVLPPPAEK